MAVLNYRAIEGIVNLSNSDDSLLVNHLSLTDFIRLSSWGIKEEKAMAKMAFIWIFHAKSGSHGGCKIEKTQIDRLY